MVNFKSTMLLSRVLRPLNLLVSGICLLVLVFPIYILRNLNRGVDMSDTGYYYVSLANWENIEIGIIAFSVIWNVLPIPDSIFLNRLCLFVGLAVSAAYLLLTTLKLIYPEQKINHVQKFCVYTIGIGCVVNYYRSWVTDPSYNSVSLLVNLVLVSVIFRMIISYQRDRMVLRSIAILSGLILLSLGFARPQTALIMAIVLVPTFIFLARPTFLHLLKIAVLSIGGMLLLVVVTSIFVEPITVTIRRIILGLEYSNILELTGTATSKFTQYKLDVRASLQGYKIWCVLLIFTLPAINLKFELTRRNSQLKFGIFATFVGLLYWYLFKQFAGSDGLLNYNARSAAELFTPLGIAAAITAIILIVGSFVGLFTSRAKTTGMISLALIFAHFAQTSLTGNNWFTFSAYFGVFTLIAIIALSGLSFNNWFAPKIFFLIPLILYPQVGSYYSTSQHPYRLFATLEEQSIPTSIRGGKSIILTDPKTNAFLNALSVAREKYGQTNTSPILIDATGRHPFVTYHINAQPTVWPWLLSGYNGSQAMFDMAISRMDDESLRSAWILYSPEYKNKHSLTILEERGLDFHRDYKIVARAKSPYIKKEVILRVPVNIEEEKQSK